MLMKKLFFLMIVCLLAVAQALAQSTVSGKVTDESGEGLPGVNVLIKGTTNGAQTDLNGNYRLTVNSGDILVFSYVGFQTQEIAAGNRTTIDITMGGATELQEVVVTGYGVQIKQYLTGNIASVSAEDIKDIPVSNVESAIQGRTAGVFIESSSGKVGEGIKVRVRGNSSISASNQPLYVVDGMIITSESQGITNNQPTNPLADINFADIESVEVLKDASAAAIYGSRASNGVVLITTKRGSSSRTAVNVRFQTGFSDPTNLIDWMNADQYREIYGEATLRFQGIDPVTATADERQAALELLDTGFGLVAGLSTDFETDTDWQDLAFNDDAGFTQLDVSASGGNQDSQFFIGLSGLDQEGILINNNLRRISGRLNLDQKIGDKLSIGGGLNLVRTEIERVSNDNAFATPLQLVALAPTQPAFVDGEPNPNTIYYNGLIEKENASAVTEIYRTFTNLHAEYQLIEGLKIRGELGLDLLDQQEDTYQGRITQDGAPGGQAQSRSVRVANIQTTSYLDYATNLGALDVNAVLGTSLQTEKRNLTSIQATGFPTDDLNTIASAAENIFQSSSELESAFVSYFLRGNLKFLDKYLLTISGRIDGSSKFGENNQYGFFPAASAGWIISDESFLAGNAILSFLKLRTSVGLTGNAPVARFAHLGTFNGANYTTTAGLRPWTLASPDLKWETTLQYDIGIDFAFLNDRVSGEIDYYKKNTSDLLLSRTLPAISGFNSVFENVGEMENEGIEVVLNSNNLVGDFQWSTSFNIAFNDNTVTKLNSEADIISGRNRVRVGQPLGVFVEPEYAGVNPANGDALFFINREATEAEISSGDVFTVDHIGSRLVTANYNLAEDVVIGDPNPDFVGGLTNSFSYKGIDLSIFFQFVYGNDVYNSGGRFQSNNASGFVDNQTVDQLRRWRQPGDITDVPRAELVGAVGDDQSSRYLQDASYLRLKTMTLGYSLPQNVLDKVSLRKVRVFLSGVNLLTFTDYNGWDPEVSTPGTNRSTTVSNITQGTDFYTAPQGRTITAGLEIGF